MMVKRKKGFGDLVKAGFEEKISIRSNGRRKRVERLEVIALQQVMQAVKGEKQALRFVLKHLAEIHSSDWTHKRVEYRYPDGSREVFYRMGKVKYVATDGAVTWYENRDQYFSAKRSADC